MARSFFKLLCAGLAFGLSSAQRPVQTLDFDIGWVHANPDGLMVRPVMGINGMWPIPTIYVDLGTQLIVNVKNSLGNQSTSLHWHGLYQNGSSQMDGVAGGTQCAFAPGASMVYNFTVDQPGTYWYHSHERGQYPDGLRGAFIVHDPNPPFQYDEEKVLTLSDWYHDQMPDLLASFISVTNPTGAEPVPDSALMNSTYDFKMNVEPNKTYFIRIINFAAFAAQYFSIQGHTFQIVEVDGVYHEPADASMIYVTAAQRYGILLTTKNNTDANYAMIGNMDQDLFDVVPPELNPNVTGWLVYDEQKPMPAATLYDEFNDFDDFYLVPQDKEPILGPVTHSITLDMKMDNLGDGANYAFFNDQTYVQPFVPTLYTALTTGQNATNPIVYGVNSNSYILKQGDVVEVVLNNNDPGKHPFHLHGHAFQAVLRSEEEAGPYMGGGEYSQTPMRRDVMLVRPDGHFIIRFRADNPGVWLFHCHIEWHVASGLVLSFIEDPIGLQEQNLVIPQDHYDACTSRGIPIAGNAAGNTEDLFNLQGAAVSVPPLPAGFTARGIVALVFSCISAFLGLAVISWYGAQPIGKSEFASARKRIDEAGVQ